MVRAMGEPTQLTSFGVARGYVLDGDALVMSGKESRTLALADIERVRLANLGEMMCCELTVRGGPPHTITTDVAGERARYAGFVRELHARLAERTGVEFIRGAWSLVVLMAVIGVVVLACGLAVHQGWIGVSPGLRGKASAIMILAVIWLVAGPFLVWGSRPRPYDPKDPPAALLR